IETYIHSVQFLLLTSNKSNKFSNGFRIFFKGRKHYREKRLSDFACIALCSFPEYHPGFASGIESKYGTYG
ncbi:MAG: hypothetical protein LWX56_07015, partial [Ignavibacteria bacterium]|nr:hypothetical protein [Ignavibacteria bacterium]